MSIIRDNYVAATDTNSTSKTYSYTCSGQLGCLLVGVTTTGDNITGVTYAGISMTQLRKQAGSDSVYTYIYGLLSPTLGANNVVISRSGSNHIISGAISYKGVIQSGLPDAVASGTGSSTTITGSITTVANRSIAFMWVRGPSGFGSPLNGSGSTLIDSSTTDGGMLESSSFPISPAGSYSMTANMLSGSGQNFCMVSLAPDPSYGNSGFMAFF